MNIMRVVAVILCAVTLSANALDEPAETVPLDSLSVREVWSLLRSWKLSALAEAFYEHEVTGESLALLEPEDVPASRFPEALPLHFKMLFKKISSVQKEHQGRVPAQLLLGQKRAGDSDEHTNEEEAQQAVEVDVDSRGRNLASSISGDPPVELSGVRIRKNASAVFLGGANDVGIVRSENGAGRALEVRGDGLVLEAGGSIVVDIGEQLQEDLAKYVYALDQRLAAMENATKAKSCRYLYERGVRDDGPQTIAVTGRDGAVHEVDLYCDMTNGGWTLVGQVEGWFDMYDAWLVDFVNSDHLASMDLALGDYACIDAVDMAVKHSTEVKISSPDATQFVRWPMDKDRTVETFWNHAAGLTAVASAGTSPVNVTYKTNADGQGKQSCYTNPYGIMPLSAHGGSYPGAFFNTAGNTVTGDYCMSIAVMLTTSSTSGNGWYQNGNGGDAPVGDEDWPNLSYVVDGQTEDQEALIWLR